MDTVFQFLFQFLGQFFGSIWNGIVSVLGAFNIPEYVNIISRYTTTLGGLAWVVAIIAILLLVAVLAFLVFLIVVSLKKFFRNKRARKDAGSLVQEVQALNREVMRLNLEKDKILSMKVSQIGLNPNEISELTGEELETLNGEGAAEGEDDIRFLKLVSAFASTRLIVLQGISGTGKTSLAYAFGKYVCNDSVITPVQPSWRDRSELFGYFNEFTKKYNETALLCAMYEANYNENVYLVILDEMNIARVEYYFAEMLSILEMPRREEWIVDLVPSTWPNDPKLLNRGQFTVPPNMWYCGTINNDDSTFAVTDKVYDRAMPINIDTKGVAFEAPDTPPVVINYHHFEDILNQAKAENPISEDLLQKLALVDDYVISHFRVAFGNRIMKQIKDYVPAFVGCGGKEIDGLDYILARKVLRKFEALNLSYIRDEIDGLIAYMDELFGEENMGECKDYLLMLKKLA